MTNVVWLPSASSAALRAHRLAPLLRPKRVALVGASPKEGTVGNGMIVAATMGEPPAEIALVNPNYRGIGDRPVYPSLREGPGPVDMAVLGVSNERLEAAVHDAIAAGVKALTIFASGYLDNDSEPKLTQRVAAMAREAGVQICGGNCMGFYNLSYGLRVCGFPPPQWMRKGGAVLLTHSGSVYSGICHNDRRMGWALAVSAGQELTTTIADYLDFALEMPETRCIGLFLETVRDPANFVAGLEKARKRDIPVIALKVGKTAASAAKAVSHSGAIAGNHAAYAALFDRHNVIEVETLDDFANALRFYSGPRRLAPGDIATMHDSGGLLELTIDRAEKHGVSFAVISDETKRKLAKRLDAGLEPTNPLDAWGTGKDYQAAMGEMMTALVEDPATACGIFCVETRDGYYLSDGYAALMEAAFARTEKPLLLSTNLGSNGSDGVAQRLTEHGIPVLSGVDSTLSVMKLALRHRDRGSQQRLEIAPASPGLREKWAPRLRQGEPLDEDASLALLEDYGLRVPKRHVVGSVEQAIAWAERIGYPVALKTAAPAVHHKSDVGGVKLDIRSEAHLRAAYEEMATRLGARMLLTQMVEQGTELALGGLHDPQFGMLLMLGAGGTLIEMLEDRTFALAPIDELEAERKLDGLKLRKLLDGVRGRPAAHLPSVLMAIARFSVMLADLDGLSAEVDVNPLIAGPSACMAVDALIVPSSHMSPRP
ncbi:acetate--CoA ligase family protein [Dongia deserti]|uniref:acetate--CoA ligase family protein n=1 Tax=Dongia deserti TaxID=2268030 RepID=UPI000E647D0A|nr:acetate--CoA ligase family protein [Dongia deserti]